MQKVADKPILPAHLIGSVRSRDEVAGNAAEDLYGTRLAHVFGMLAAADASFGLYTLQSHLRLLSIRSPITSTTGDLYRILTLYILKTA
jgi:hypothetical protein